MTIDPSLRSLNIDLPACPHTLVKLSLLIASDKASVDEMAGLIGADMALASAIVRTVNSAMFGLLHRVETVHEAVRYLGMREVAGITYEMGLRAAFPPGPLIDRVWDRAGRRGLAMGRIAQALDFNPWTAHTAGLFAESGRAVLYAYDRERYSDLEQLAPNEGAVIAAEVATFGVSHAALGAALCQSWGLSQDVATYVRARVSVPLEWQHESLDVRRLLTLGAEVDAELDPSGLAAGQTEEQRNAQRAERAALAEVDAALLLAKTQRVLGKMAEIDSD